MILIPALVASTLFLAPQSPSPAPDPNPGGGYTNLLPAFTVQGDGTRLQCTTTYNYCWPDTSGLPSYLEG